MGREKPTHECECGTEYVAWHSTACPDCAFLDGNSKGMGGVISILRMLGTATAEQMAAELGCTRSNIQYRCQTLAERGRVRMRRIDNDAIPRNSGVVWNYSLMVER